MSRTIRLTAAQAMMRWLRGQLTEDGERFIAGVWAIFGHGNVAGIGEALHAARRRLPDLARPQRAGHGACGDRLRQGLNRKRAMAVTSSIGPGATNMVTAAALAHVNRLPVLLHPRRRLRQPPPRPGAAADRGLRRRHGLGQRLLPAGHPLLRPHHPPRAAPDRAAARLRTMTDPADCGPVTLAFCQDVQAEAFDYPASFFAPEGSGASAGPGLTREVEVAADAIRAPSGRCIVAGGGVLYSEADGTARGLRRAPATSRSSRPRPARARCPWDHPLNLGSIGVTGSAANNAVAPRPTSSSASAPGSRTSPPAPGRCSRTPTGGSSRSTSPATTRTSTAPCRSSATPSWRSRRSRRPRRPSRPRLGPPQGRLDRRGRRRVTAAPGNALPTDAQVIGAVQRAAGDDAIVVCAAGTMPGELHKLWQAGAAERLPHGVRLSCMGYEIAGGLGRQDGAPRPRGRRHGRRRQLHDAELRARHLGDARAEAHRAARQPRLRLHQPAAAGERRRRVQQPVQGQRRHAVPSAIDFAAHAASMGAHAEKVADIAELEAALVARPRPRPHLR